MARRCGQILPSLSSKIRDAIPRQTRAEADARWQAIAEQLLSSMSIKTMDSIENGLIIAPKLEHNLGDAFSTGGGGQDLAAAQEKSIGRMQPDPDLLLFVQGQCANKKGMPHAFYSYSITFSITFGGKALVGHLPFAMGM